MSDEKPRGDEETPDELAQLIDQLAEEDPEFLAELDKARQKVWLRHTVENARRHSGEDDPGSD